MSSIPKNNFAPADGRICSERGVDHAPDPVGGFSPLTVRGGVYLGLRYGLGILVSLGNMFVMTRWIGPHAYGLFVTALGLTSFLAALSRGGIDTYIVRLESAPDRKLYDVATTLILGHSTLLVIGGASAIPLLTRWFGSHEFVPAYLVTLLTIPLAGLAGPPTAKLERELNFRAVAGIELGGQVLALVVSTLMAWQGYGVWAPVTGLLAWQAWAAFGALAAARLNPTFRFDAAIARAMLSFGAGYSASLRVWQLRTLVNPLLVGRFAGTEAVAFVALAIRIAEGLGFVRIAAGRLAIAALSRLREDRSRFQATLESALKIQVLTLGPLLCLFALVAPALVPRLMGVRWLPSLQVYPFVAAGVLVNSLYNLQASALFVHGQQWVVLRAYAGNVALLGIGTAILLPRIGILGYGWAELLACAGYGVLHVGLARLVTIPYKKLAWAVIVCLAPLFTSCTVRLWRIALWIPMLAFIGVAIWNRASAGSKRFIDDGPQLASAIRVADPVLPRTGT